MTTLNIIMAFLLLILAGCFILLVLFAAFAAVGRVSDEELEGGLERQHRNKYNDEL